VPEPDPERVLELSLRPSGPDRRNDSAGLRAVVVIDSTRRGPAFGGIRRAAYPDLAAATADARALARAMTLKCALAGLPAGGAKTAVVDDGIADRTVLYAALGDAIEALRGAYVAGPDIGTGARELDIVRSRTVHCNPASNDASAATAAGVLSALRAVWPALGGGAPRGASAIVQGLGGVGSIVARELVALGVRVMGCDPDDDACARARDHGVTIVPVDDALDRTADVLVPCATGGILDEARATSVRVRAVCGSANNQLVDAAARVLLERGIVHVPDIVASAGAVIEGVRIVLGGDTPATRAQVRRDIATIETTAARVLAAAQRERTPAEAVAMAWARAAVA
jgi:glutamate dehydrogenase/leucine dehydrogenase